jgi:hypoxanthine-DNA glycosylase
MSDELSVPAGETEVLTKFSFPPIVGAHARLLILGTLPGEESLRLRQYYGHPRNHFWPLIAAIFDESLPATYAERERLLKRNRWALWDVLECAKRVGSLDSAIRKPTANAFAKFFAGYPDIRTIAFNGQKARSLFRRHVVKQGVITEGDFTLLDLPSSSPLYTKPFEEKLAAWRATLAGR